jgi:hypothetical protein
MVLRLQTASGYQRPGGDMFLLSYRRQCWRSNLDVIDRLYRELSGKLFGDRGYISQALFEHLYQQGIQLVLPGYGRT